MKIVNTSKTPYEWTFDGKQWGPILPGEVKDYPSEIALHAIKRSAVLDDMGEVLGFRVESLESARQNPEKLRSMLSYECPLIVSGDCHAEPFKSMDALRTHMEVFHWPSSEREEPLLGSSQRKVTKQ